MTIHTVKGVAYENVEVFTTSSEKVNVYIFMFKGDNKINYLPFEEFGAIID